MSLFKLKAPPGSLIYFLTLLSITFFLSHYVNGQATGNLLKGNVTDGSTGKSLPNVVVANQSDSASVIAQADGNYQMHFGKGKYNILFRAEGYQSKLITSVESRQGGVTGLDVVLFPVSQTRNGDAQKRGISDSVSSRDSFVSYTRSHEMRISNYNRFRFANLPFDNLSPETIQPGTDKNAAQLLKRLAGVIVQDLPATGHLRSIQISGLGERYNQVLFNGAVMPGFEAGSRVFPLGSIPVEAVETAEVQQIANPSLPADVAGGTVMIKTRDLPDRNFYYVQAGMGFSEGTIGKDFLSDKKGKTEWLSFPGSVRNLPAGFPTTRSQYGLDEKNPQEQVYLSKLLTNNLSPLNYGSSQPDHHVLLGVGKINKFRKGQTLGLLAFLQHQKAEIIDQSVIQVQPDITGNLFPFADAGRPLIMASSRDLNYRFNSSLTGIVNASFLFRNHKISLKNFFGSDFLNTFTQKSDFYKYADDSLAHHGVFFKTEQRKFLSTQLSGEHMLGANNRLKIDWLASYTNYRQKDPDERNFLLRQDAGDLNRFEIANQIGQDDITHTGRSWKEYTDHNFTGLINVQIPFNLLRHSQVLSGGIFIQNKYRVFFSDLLLTKGSGYFSLDDLLSPERYFPGGLSVTNYFTRKNLTDGNSTIQPDNRGNYTASSNIGAAYLKLENRLANSLSVNWGLRVESSTQLASSSQYQYFKSYKNPQIISLDKNIRVINYNFLPSVHVNYLPVNMVALHAAFFQTVNRPQLQELCEYRYYDPTVFLVTRGNSLLTAGNIENYDAGIKWMPAPATTISISGFYKKIDRPVELILSAYNSGNMQQTSHNTPPATVRGIQTLIKTKLDFISSASWLSNITFFANGTWLRSKVKAGPLKSLETPDIASHSLSGSPDYSVNSGLTIQVPRLPNLTLLYSRTGDYITAVGYGANFTLMNGNTISAIPDYRVKGSEKLDIQLSQQFYQSKIQLILGVNNLLASPYVQYQDLNGNKKYDTALALRNNGNKGGFYQSGIDNTVLRIESKPVYYLRISYLFK